MSNSKNHKKAISLIVEAQRFGRLYDLVHEIAKRRPSAIINAVNTITDGKCTFDNMHEVYAPELTDFDRSVIEHAKEHTFISCIKHHRTIAHSTLRVAKDRVDWLHDTGHIKEFGCNNGLPNY